MSTIRDSYKQIADINLWLKIQSGDTYTLADMPSIIPLRWTYFRDYWEFIKPNFINNVTEHDNPDFFNSQISDFSKFITTQRIGNSRINPFSDGTIFFRFYTIFDFIAIDSINLSNEERSIVTSEVARVTAFSKNDFLRAKAQIIDYRDMLTDIYDLGDTTYSNVYNKSPIAAQISATIVEVNYLLKLQDMLKAIDFILANLFAVDTVLDPFALARTNANNPDVNIGQYKSGQLVKIRYGENLQSLANRYLGNPDSWIDIAIANGLKSPYVDEVGSTVQLLSNGNGNQINLANIDSFGQLNVDKLYINQIILLQSNVLVIPDQRTIINIRQIPISGEIILELDGEADLDQYAIVDGAYIRVFAPNTINSSFFVLIPSSQPLPDNRVDEVPWFLAKSSEDEKRAKIDLALDSSGDLILTTNGDVKLSYGLENAVQAIMLKILTEQGSLRLHPQYGLTNIIGQTTYDITALKSIVATSINQQISIDPRFDRVESFDIRQVNQGLPDQSPSGFIVNMTVRLAGGTRVIPISFSVNNK